MRYCVAVRLQEIVVLEDVWRTLLFFGQALVVGEALQHWDLLVMVVG